MRTFAACGQGTLVGLPSAPVLRGLTPGDEGRCPHGLRRTFASLLVAMDYDIAMVMQQMGRTSPTMTLGVYAAAMD